MRTPRRVGDVSHLPHHAFGPAAITWWGMWGLMLIEGATMALVAASYLYIRGRFDRWPPPPLHHLELLAPIIALVVMLVSVIPAVTASRYARAHDRAGVLWSLVAQSALNVAWIGLRLWEFQSLNVKWDTNAYGSVVWAVLVTHALVAFSDVLDTIGLTALFAFSEPEEKHFVDTTENSIFWYFTVGAWVVLFVLVYLYPRWS